MSSNWWIHVAVPIVAAGLTNAYIFSTGFKMESYKYSLLGRAASPWLPPGAVIGTIWFLLFGVFGYLHFLLYRRHGDRLTSSNIVLWVLVGYCLLYPFATQLNPSAGLLMNLGALELGFLTAGFIAYTERWRDTLWFIPYLLWTTYVNVVFNIACSNVK